MTVYSERFLIAENGGTWTAWQVPAGHRAVIKTILAVNDTDAEVTAGVIFQGRLNLWLRRLPAHSAVVDQELSLALYAGESIAGTSAAAGCATTVSGFLFEDATGRTSPPGDSWSGALERGSIE